MERYFFRKKDDYFSIMSISIYGTGWGKVKLTKLFSDGRPPEIKNVCTKEDIHEYVSAMNPIPSIGYNSEWQQETLEKLSPSEFINLLEAEGLKVEVSISENIEDQSIEH